MTIYKEIYSFNVIDAITEGKNVGMVDKKKHDCFLVNDMTVDELAAAIKTSKTEKTRYEFWIEETTED